MKIEFLKSAATLLKAMQTTIGPKSGLSNEIPCIFAAQGAANLLDLEVEGLKNPCILGLRLWFFKFRLLVSQLTTFFVFSNFD